MFLRKFRMLRQHFFGHVPCHFKQIGIHLQIGITQQWDAALARPDELARTANLQVLPGDLEAVGVLENARQRLKIIFENTDGFEIARQDLQIRGPGEFVGSRQSGVPLLRYADLEMDADLVEMARDVAEHMLTDHAELAERHLQRWLGSREELLKS